MRRPRVSVVIAGCLLSAGAACGSSTPSSGGTTTTKAPVVNPAADRVTARAINLVAGDLPGWTQTAGDTNTVSASDVQVAACTGVPNPKSDEDVNVNSANFAEDATEVSSSVAFVRTDAEGLEDLRAFAGPKITSCLRQVGSSELSSQLPVGATIGNINVTRVSVPSLPGNAFALRLTLDITTPEAGVVDMTGDELGFVSGRAEVGLTVFQEEGTPSASLEHRLLSVLEARTQQQGNSTA